MSGNPNPMVDATAIPPAGERRRLSAALVPEAGPGPTRIALDTVNA